MIHGFKGSKGTEKNLLNCYLPIQDSHTMATTFKIINPIDYHDWDNQILSLPGHSIFHSTAWARVLMESYEYKPLYFCLIENGRLCGLIPVMEVASFLTGRRGVSLPFTDYCESLCDDETSFSELLSHATGFGKQASWKFIELRGSSEFLNGADPSTSYLAHTLPLSKDEHELFSKFRSSTKRNVKKASALGVSTLVLDSFDALTEYYRLHCLTRKEHGVPPQPFSFFELIYKHILAKGSGIVILGLWQGRVVSAAVFIHFGNKAHYKYGASDKAYQHLRANNLVMWEAIRYYSQSSFATFCFGRTDPENVGLRQFKMGWAPDEHLVNYYRYDLSKSKYTKTGPESSHLKKMFFTNMPIPIAQFIGRIAYRHVG